MVSENYRVSPPEVWNIACATRLHFAEGKYDAFKFNFKMPYRNGAFDSRRDRYFYEKIARQYTNKKMCIEFFLSNIIAGKTWIGDMTAETHSIWQNKMQSILYIFKNDISECKNYCDQKNIQFDDMFSGDEELPHIFKLYMSEKISLETLCILDILCNYCAHINKIGSDPMGLLKETSRIVVSYKPFLLSRINKQKYKEIVINTFTSL